MMTRSEEELKELARVRTLRAVELAEGEVRIYLLMHVPQCRCGDLRLCRCRCVKKPLLVYKKQR